MLYVLLAAVVVGFLLIVLQPAWMPRAPKALSSDVLKRAPKVSPAAVTSRLTSGWRKEQPALIATSSPELGELESELMGVTERYVAWLGTCTEAERAALSRAIARSTSALDFQVAWRDNATIARDRKLRLAVDEVLALSGMAAWRAAEVGRQARTQLALEAWEQNPSSFRQRDLTAKLYAALVQRGLVTVRPELYLAKDQDRRSEAIEAIRRLANSNRAEVLATLDELLHSKPAATPAPALDAPEPAVVSAPAAPELSGAD
jgi:hypothetical protein